MKREKTYELLKHELEKWLSGNTLLQDRIFDYEQLRTAVGKFVHTLPKYMANGITRFAINTTGEPDNHVDLAKLVHIAYFCHAKCNKIIGGMPYIFQVDNARSIESGGLEYTCKLCKCLLSKQIQL